MESKIEKEIKKSRTYVSRVYVSHYQKPGTVTAELKQEVNTISLYPDKIIRDDLHGNIYDISEFEQAQKKYDNKRTDVAWIDIPEGQTFENVLHRLNDYPKATLYRILSSEPIMSSSSQMYYDRLVSEGQEAMAAQFKDRVANSQVLRYGSDSDDESIKKGELILDAYGKPQFKACFLDETGEKQDQDFRIEDATSYYKTMEILMILNNTIQVTAPQQQI